MKMMEHNLNQMKQRLDTLNPIMFVQLETKLEELQKDLYDLRNLYSAPTSSLNRVLDGVLKKVKELEKAVGLEHISIPGASQLPNADGFHNELPGTAGSNPDQNNFYQRLTSQRRGTDAQS